MHTEIEKMRRWVLGVGCALLALLFVQLFYHARTYSASALDVILISMNVVSIFITIGALLYGCLFFGRPDRYP